MAEESKGSSSPVHRSIGEEIANEGMKAGNFLTSSLNIVDEFLSGMEDESMVIKKVSKADDAVVPERLRRQCAYHWHTNKYWTLFITVSILLNAIQIGLDVEITGKMADDTWLVCDFIFTVIFTLEMIVAIVAQRLYYFYNAWNYLDFAVANIAIINTWIIPLVESDGDGSLTTFRVFRLLKLLRVAKMLKIIPELMMVVQGLIASMKAMFWICMLLIVFLYTAGIFCKEIIGVPDAGYHGFSEEGIMDVEVIEEFNNYMYFGSVARSMITLFNMVILAEWQEVLRPVAEQQPAMVVFFVCVVFLCSFGVLNVMIGIVVEHTTSAMQEQRHAQQIQLQKSQIKLASTLADLVFTMDVDNDQKLTQEELEHEQNAAELHAIIGNLGLPHGYSLGELFAMLDVDGNGSLSKLEFVQGIMRLIYCDQFQRDCLFRTAIGQVKQAIARNEECLKESINQQFQETRTHVMSAFKQLHEGGLRAASTAPLHQGEWLVASTAAEHTASKVSNESPHDFAPERTASTVPPEHSQLSHQPDITQVVYVGVLDPEPSSEVQLEGNWEEIVSAEIVLSEYVQVTIMDANASKDAPTVSSIMTKSKDVKDVNLCTSCVTDLLPDPGKQGKKLTRRALQNSLVPARRKTGTGSAFDVSAADQMFGLLSHSCDVIGWMPVVSIWQTNI